jgi:mRNA interferase MazF
MTRGEIRLAELEPAVRSEANKRRPVVLVGNPVALTSVERRRRGVVTVVPLTSNARWSGVMHVVIQPSPLNGLTTPSKAQAEQVMSLDYSRFSSVFGRLSDDDLSAVDDALRFHLALD